MLPENASGRGYVPRPSSLEHERGQPDLGSQSGSHPRQTPSDAGRRGRMIRPVRRLIGRRQATSRDLPGILFKQRIAGSNPAGHANFKYLFSDYMGSRRQTFMTGRWRRVSRACHMLSLSFECRAGSLADRFGQLRAARTSYRRASCRQAATATPVEDSSTNRHPDPRRHLGPCRRRQSIAADVRVARPSW
jgi:hypothetical protein